MANEVDSLDMKRKIDFDDLLEKIGKCGRYQRLRILFFTLFPVIASWAAWRVLFVLEVPNHWCKVPALTNLNLSHNELLNLTIPYETTEYSKCEMYDRNYTSWTEENVLTCLTDPSSCQASSVKCIDGWSYDTSEFTTNYIIDFDIICGKTWLRSAPISIYSIGVMVSCLVFGNPSDMFGRKKTFLWAHMFHLVFSFGVTFAPSLVTYLLFRFLMGACDQLWYTSFTMGVEMVGVSSRHHVAMHMSYSYVIGLMSLALICYLIRDWFYTRLFISLMSIAILSAIWVLDESPRWLYAANKEEEATKISRKMAKSNGKDFPEGYKVTVKTERTGRIWDLFSRGWIRKRYFNMAYQYFVMALLYSGLMIYLSNIGGSPYLNVFLSCAVEIPGNIIAQMSLHFLPRRKPYTAALFISAIVILTIMAVPTEMYKIRLALALIGRGCNVLAWSILGVICVEVFPTVLRKVGYNSSQIFAGFGVVLSPYIVNLGQMNQYIPPSMFGSLALIGAAISLFIPETKNQHLLDKLDYEIPKEDINGDALNTDTDHLEQPHIISGKELVELQECTTFKTDV